MNALPAEAMDRSPRASAGPESFRIIAPGTPEAVRGILADLRGRLETLGTPPDDCGRVEISVAEALNNIVEHAFPPEAVGTIRLRGRLHRGRLDIALRDDGRALPGLRLPDSELPPSCGPIDALPEGGFGWPLIHRLTDRLRYRREAAGNLLCLGFVINDTR